MTGALLRDAAKYLLAFLVAALIEFARLPVLTRVLSPQQYGDYALILGAAGLLALIAASWLGSGVLRFYPRLARAYSVSAITPAFLGAGLMSLLAVGGLAVAAYVATPGLSRLFPASLAGLTLLLFASLSIERIVVATLRSRRALWRNLAYVAVQGPLGLILGYWLATALDLGVSGFVIGAVAATGVAAVGVGAGHGWSGTAWRLLGDRAVAAEIARYGLPVVGINLLTWVSSSSDRFLIGLFRGPDEVGVYAAGYTLAEKSIFLFTYVVSLASHPLATRAWEEAGPEASRALLRQSARLFLLTALPATVGLAVVADIACRVLLPAEYLAARHIVAPVAAGAFLLGLGNLFTEAFALRQRTGLLLGCYALAAAVNVALNLLLVPAGGYPMAALSTLVSYATFLGVTATLSRRLLTWQFPWGTLLRSGIATAGMAGVVAILTRALPGSQVVLLIAGVAGGLIAYAGALLLLGEVGSADLARVRAAVARATGPGASATAG